MLHFPDPLTPAATDILVYCLEISADLAGADTPDDEWAMAYPLSSKCLTRQLAREVLLDLLDKLRLPQAYVPTSYHWLLMYECLDLHIECLNDDFGPDFLDSLKTSQEARDARYLCFPLKSQGEERVSIDFEAFIETYFWDTDFLLDPSTFYQLGAPSRKQLGYPDDLFGVLTGLFPHPAELILKTIDEVETAESEGDEGTGEF